MLFACRSNYLQVQKNTEVHPADGNSLWINIQATKFIQKDN